MDLNTGTGMEVRRFDETIGHEDTVSYIQNAIQNGKVNHAYIFSGERGSGKKLLASLFAATLQCKEKRIEPCGSCTSCRKAFTENHPDIIYVTHEKPNIISVDEIREQVVDTAEIKPYESEYKIYIIDEAQKMNPQAQNALLKTIEEPPEYVIIMLLASNAEMLLPTIRSRCIIYDIKPVAAEVVKDYIMRNLHVSEHEANVVAAYANGNIGKARQAVLSEDFDEMMTRCLNLVTKTHEMSISQCVSAALSIAKDKANINACLDIFTLWYKDVLTFKATRDVDLLIFKTRIEDITYRAAHSSYEGLENILNAIKVARTRIKANVNAETTMELLFLTVMEN